MRVVLLCPLDLLHLLKRKMVHGQIQWALVFFLSKFSCFFLSFFFFLMQRGKEFSAVKILTSISCAIYYYSFLLINEDNVLLFLFFYYPFSFSSSSFILFLFFSFSSSSFVLFLFLLFSSSSSNPGLLNHPLTLQKKFSF